MGKLYYFYGTMSSAKSLNLLVKKHQMESVGSKIMLMKPAVDTREEGVISSRVGLREECTLIRENKEIVIPDGVNVVMVDEVQFLSPDKIKEFWKISRTKNIRVFCFGLKVTYTNELFEGIKTLLVLCDCEYEIKSQCSRCENKATTHIMLKNDEPVLAGDIVNIGDIKGEVRYEALCADCRFELIGEI